MPMNRTHAFASGKALPRPEPSPPPGRMERLWRRIEEALDARRQQRRVREVWECFERQAVVGEKVLLGPNAWIVNSGAPQDVEIGEGSVVRGLLRRDRHGDGKIRIARNVYLGDDVLLSCMSQIEIEEGVMVAHGAQVFDNDSHPTDPDARLAHWLGIRYGKPVEVPVARAPVRIRRGAWIGMNALVMKGVTVGEFAIIAAGSVVTKDVPDRSLAAGNPARVIGTFAESEVS